MRDVMVGTIAQGYYGSMRAGVDAAVAAGKLDEDAQEALILGALDLAGQMDGARKVTPQQLRLLLSFSKALGLLPAAGR
ncbi:hypothetical protein [Olsenella phocaeensis]|uniref:hypothetical protein n=1 Tax=Olsenella phocaeensis TaxID=1852385 RepID=UPI003A9017C0